MKKRKVASLLLATTLAATLLTGCQETGSTVVENAKTAPAMEQVVAVEEQQIPESRTYEAFEHVYFVRYYTARGTYPEKIYGGQIEIPAGYEILDIENWNETEYKSSQTGGFDVWFINNQPVEVQPVFNAALGYYDYSEPGIVVERELEETGVSLNLTP